MGTSGISMPLRSSSLANSRVVTSGLTKTSSGSGTSISSVASGCSIGTIYGSTIIIVVRVLLVGVGIIITDSQAEPAGIDVPVTPD